MKKAKWENWMSFVLGLWLFITPWTMVSSLFSNAASWNAWIVGAGIMFSAYSAVRNLKPWEEWVNITLGVWVFFSPWIFGYAKDSGHLWNCIVVGLGVTVLSAFALPEARKLQHL